MPFYYDVSRAETSNGSAGTFSTHFYSKTVANQDSFALKAVYVASRFGTAGGAQYRIQSNSGTTASGGTSQTPGVRAQRGAVAAQTTWFNDGTAITAGATLVQRVSIGFAQTGGTGGWVPVEPTDSLQQSPNAASPVDFEYGSIASSASVTFDATHEFSEGV